MATTLKTWINKLFLKCLDSLQVAYIIRNNSDHLLLLHVIRKNYLLTFTKMYYHCVEGISFQPISMFSYLRTKTKSLLSDLPASGYWSDRVSWNVLSLETSKAPGTYPNIAFMSSSLKSLNVLLTVYMFWNVFKATPKSVFAYP